ncbi:hypothetical protein CDES_05175 [Corynebacterium deserti GIMN1.010]|uniref:Metallo-beta-lactamase domain-containing protein n=1 Tax=Corynebacterium deserti GIMN1.010 TaxID=931089 RepID=A0A0M4CL52_9CORY|nr:MBL fold metallo-hydrolase [Corynebacterium deserti]ALC05472.1 hypothetical protein CDES_05175 [Corynebacterium deserti GIMN1.010]
MKITRHIHACVEIEHEGTRLIIDPGSFGAPDLTDATILFTHNHADHVDPSILKRGMDIYAPKSVAHSIPVECHVVAHSRNFTVGSMTVEVLGSEHAMLTKAQPIPENVGYLINGKVLHPGDAFQPLKGVELALVPVNGPWVKMLDVEAFLKKFPPKRFVGIHDGIVNERGLAINKKFLTLLAEEYGSEYVPLQEGESVEL